MEQRKLETDRLMNMQVRLPGDLYNRIKIIAFEENKSISLLVHEVLMEVFPSEVKPEK
jgi:hypothetical protein